MIKKIRNKIKSKLDIHTFNVLINTIKSLFIKLVGISSGFLVSIYIGRNLGSEGLGIINFANKLLIILIVISMFGFQNVIIKFISIAKGTSNNKKISTTLKTSLLFNGLLSILITVIAIITLNTFFYSWSVSEGLFFPLLIVFISLVPQTISRIYSAALNGYGKVWQSNLVNNNLTVFLVLFGLLIYFLFNVELNPVSVLILYLISRLLESLIIFVIWKGVFKINIKGEFKPSPMFKIAMPLLLVTGTSVISNNIDIVMLGSLGTLSDVGIYSVAVLLSMFISLFLQASNIAIAPKLADLFFQKKINEIQFMVKNVTTGLTLIAILTMLFFILFGKQLLSLWGAGFHDAYLILVILAAGQVVNISTGCSGYLLVMCGFEKIHGYISLFGILLNITLNLFLISKYGALGAGMATSITVIIENMNKVYWVKKKTGILTIPSLSIK